MAEGRRFWLTLAYVAALALPLLVGLGGAPLFDVDEGAFSEATREMLVSADWWHTTLNGEPRFDKPVGVYWLQAASVAIFGLGEFALRLPSALSGLALALAVASFAAARWGRSAGALAGVVMVSSLGTQAIFRCATADALLNLLLVLAALDLWRFFESSRATPLRRAYLWVGLGLLVKGPVAALVPAAAFVIGCAWNRRWDRLRQAAGDAPGWALLLAVAAPWYAYALQRHGMAFVDGFLVRHNLQRFSATLESHGGSPLYYLWILPLLAMPWAPFAIAAVARGRTLWRDPLERYLLGWAGFVLVFFSLSGTKLPHYMLYGFAPIALLVGRQVGLAGRATRTLWWLVLFVWAATMVILPWEIRRHAPELADPLYRALLAGAPEPGWQAPAAALLLMGAFAWWPHAALRPAPRLAGAALALAALMGGWAAPWWGEALQGPVGRAAAAARDQAPGTPAVQWGVHLPSFAVYLGQPVPRRAPLAGELALARRDRLPPHDPARLPPPLFEERGIVVFAPWPPVLP